jgi:hypothetical protein
MTTTTDRAAELREVIAEAERQMGIHAGTHLFAVYLARRGDARRELRQMEES